MQKTYSFEKGSELEGLDLVIRRIDTINDIQRFAYRFERDGKPVPVFTGGTPRFETDDANVAAVGRKIIAYANNYNKTQVLSEAAMRAREGEYPLEMRENPPSDRPPEQIAEEMVGGLVAFIAETDRKKEFDIKPAPADPEKIIARVLDRHSFKIIDHPDVPPEFTKPEFLHGLKKPGLNYGDDRDYVTPGLYRQIRANFDQFKPEVNRSPMFEGSIIAVRKLLMGLPANIDRDKGFDIAVDVTKELMKYKVIKDVSGDLVDVVGEEMERRERKAARAAEEAAPKGEPVVGGIEPTAEKKKQV